MKNLICILLWLLLAALDLCGQGFTFRDPALVIPAAAGGGGGGTWTFGSSGNNASAGSTTTITVQLTGVTAGDTIVLGVKWEGATTTATCSDGTSSLSGGTVVDNAGNGDLSSKMFYLLSSVASGTVTYTVTLGAARSFKNAVAARWSHTGGTVAFDAEATGGGDDNVNTTSHTSGATLTTTGSANIAVAFYASYGDATNSTPQINSVNNDGTDANGTTVMWWRNNIGATMSNAAATTTTAANAYSCINLLSIKL